MSVKIRQRKNGTIEVDIIVTTPSGQKIRERRRSPVTSKTGSLRWAQQRERELAMNGRVEPQPKKPEVPTLAEFADEFLRHASTSSKPNTMRAKRRNVDVLLHYFGSVKLDSIDARAVARFTSARLSEPKLTRCRAGSIETVAARTVNFELGTLRQVLAVAVKFGIIEQAPTIDALPERAKPARFLDVDETARFVAAAKLDEPTWYLWALLAVRTGMRIGEQAALRWRDIDFAQRQVTIERTHSRCGGTASTKSGRARVVPLAADVFAELLANKGAPDDLVFKNRDGGEVPATTVYSAIRRISVAAGLGRCNPHTTRHAFGACCVAQGVPLPVLQRWLGHSKVTTTSIYASFSPELGRELIERLAPAPVLRLVDRGAGVDSLPSEGRRAAKK